MLSVLKLDPFHQESRPSKSAVPVPSSKKLPDGFDAEMVLNKEQDNGSDAIVKPESIVALVIKVKLSGKSSINVSVLISIV